MIQARCAVCGTDLDGAVRACARCESIYHRDCWDYNDGCAIYGCRRVVGRAKLPKIVTAPPRVPPPPWQSAAFGALIGVATILLASLAVDPRDTRDLSHLVGCAALLGAVSGPLLRPQLSWILFTATAGPGLAAWALGILGLPLLQRPEAAGMVLCLPVFVLFGVVMSPLALPCAILAAYFNDPVVVTPRLRWVALGLALVVAVGAGFYSFSEARGAV